MPKISDKDFLRYIEQYQNLVFSICLSYTKNIFDAEDLAQETFMSAYRKRDTFDGRNFKGWITMISANKCRDFLRVQHQTEVIDDYDIADDNSMVEVNVINKCQREEIYKLCCKLKDPYKEVAIRYFVEDLKLSQQQKISGENLKTLQTRLYRAKQRLKELWREENGL